jgi:hypothetical protein
VGLREEKIRGSQRGRGGKEDGAQGDCSFQFDVWKTGLGDRMVKDLFS